MKVPSNEVPQVATIIVKMVTNPLLPFLRCQLGSASLDGLRVWKLLSGLWLKLFFFIGERE